MIIGIDPGFDGGLAAIKMSQFGTEDTGGLEPEVIGSEVMPVLGEKKRVLNPSAIISFLDRWGTKHESLIVIEKVHAMPKQGVASSFNFGMGYGQLQGICAALQLPVVLVTPQQWKKVILVGYAKPGKGASEKEKKAAAVQYVQQKYPKLDLRASSRCRNPHYGIVDAICLAEYGLWLHSNGGVR